MSLWGPPYVPLGPPFAGTVAALRQTRNVDLRQKFEQFFDRFDEA
jgi:hypothetical protein